MRTDKRKRIAAFSFIMILLLSVSCGGKDEKTEKTGYAVYYLSDDETMLEKDHYECSGETREEQIDELLARLSLIPEGSTYSAPLQMGFQLRDYSMEGDQLVLSLDSGYRRLDAGTEILVRAALVRTLTQAPGVEGVSILVDGVPLTDAAGNLAGMMKADSFILNDSVMEDSVRRAELTLYFANEDGNALKAVRRIVEYGQNVLPEQLVVEQLIAGVQEDGIQPVIPSDTRVLSVTNDDGICYVNLDQGFLNPSGDITPEVGLYSIVNSLAELGNVRSVQFLVNGESNILYRELLDLNRQYSGNLDIIED